MSGRPEETENHAPAPGGGPEAAGEQVPEGESDSSTGWVEAAAMRLLGAFHDMSGGKPEQEVPLWVPGGEGVAPEGRGAAQEAGFDPSSVRGSVERDVAVRYLLNNGYIEGAAKKGAANYRISADGIVRVRRMRGLPVEESSQGPERSGMSEKMQTRLLSILTIVLFVALNGRVKKLIDRRIPERRGVRDDLLEAGLQGMARTAAVLAAAVVVRRLAGPSR